jgi:hypothetical protein
MSVNGRREAPVLFLRRIYHLLSELASENSASTQQRDTTYKTVLDALGTYTVEGGEALLSKSDQKIN